MRLAIASTAVALGIAALPAHAEKYKCGCEANAKADLEKSKDPKIECAETYNGYSSSVSIQDSHLKIYVDSKNVVQGDKDANIRFAHVTESAWSALRTAMRERFFGRAPIATTTPTRKSVSSS